MDQSLPEGTFEEGSLVVGRYRIENKIGSGGMGEVFLAHDDATDRTVAIKVLFPHYANDKIVFSRFRNEVEIASKLDHPRIVRLFELGSAGEGSAFVSMELVTGGTLADRIYDGESQLSVLEQIEFLVQIADGLAYAHDRGIVHRDLKPENILITETGEVKVADFGLARSVHIELHLTPSGEAVGTPYYMSPEQVRGKGTDARSDIYSLGIIAFEMLCKRRPFQAENYMAVATMHLTYPLPDVNEFCQGAPRSYRHFIENCCEKKPTNRYSSMHEIKDELLTIKNEIAGVIPSGGLAGKLKSLFSSK